MEHPAGKARQPLTHLWMLVGRIVVDDGVDRLFDGDLRLDRIEEADELLVAMALHVTANDSAIEDVEGCERCTERRLTPAALASIRPVQWVASPGGGPSVSSTTLCTVVVGSGCLPGLRVLSRVSPATPSAMNRACHRHTTGFDLPDRRMISAVPQPSAVARTMLARHTCFCGALRSEMIASSRRRSARVTFTTIPALMMRA